MAWRVARSLTEFHENLKKTYPRSVPPATDVNSWGIIGDLSHTSTSDHSPHNFPGWGNEIVTAADWPHVPHLGLDAGVVAEAIRLSRDSRVKYVIFDGRMFSSYISGSTPGWTWRQYNGADSHSTHGHLSVVGDARSDERQAWMVGDVEPEGKNMALDFNQNSKLDGIFNLTPTVTLDVGGGVLTDFVNPIAATMVGIRADLAELKAKSTDSVITLTPAQVVELGNLVANNLATNTTFLAAVANAVLDEDNARTAD